MSSDRKTGDTPEDHGFGDGYRLQASLDWVRAGGSVLFFGPKGVGKSLALDIHAAAAEGFRVLRCAPLPADPDRAYRDLAELLSGVADSELSPLPWARRRVLAGILLRRADSATHGRAVLHSRRARWTTRATSAAVRTAVLNLLRVLARSGPLLLVVDNAELLDRGTADVLRFVASRAGDPAIQMVAAEQVTPDRAPTGRLLCPGPLLMTRPDPLSSPGVPDSRARRRQGGKGAPWAACRRRPDPVN